MFNDYESLSISLDKVKPVLLVVPAISVGKAGLNDQYRDYLDQAALLYGYLSKHKFSVNIFALGAEHRGDGFLHQIGKEYLLTQHSIPTGVFVWDDEKFRKVGLCSVEEAELTVSFLAETEIDYQIVTSISQSQHDRYVLHHLGYGINAKYFVFPDNKTYYHLENQDQENMLLAVTKKDPRWESEIGQDLRKLAHRLRDPYESPVTQEEMQAMIQRISKYLA